MLIKIENVTNYRGYGKLGLYKDITVESTNQIEIDCAFLCFISEVEKKCDTFITEGNNCIFGSSHEEDSLSKYQNLGNGTTLYFTEGLFIYRIFSKISRGLFSFFRLLVGLIFKWGLFSSGAYFPNHEFQMKYQARNSNKYNMKQTNQTQKSIKNLGMQDLHVFYSFIGHF